MVTVSIPPIPTLMLSSDPTVVQMAIGLIVVLIEILLMFRMLDLSSFLHISIWFYCRSAITAFTCENVRYCCL